MGQNDIYDELAAMINEDGYIRVRKSESFLRLLRLQFTHEEASLAVHVRCTGSTITDITQRSGIPEDRLAQMLETMADKGTIYIGPGQDDKIYQVVGVFGPGLLETGLWGNIRFPFTVELGKAMYEVIQEYWPESRVGKVSFPYAPIWAGMAALPEDVLPSENLAEAIKEAGHWSVSFCPCRLSHWISDPGNHCEHMLETCIQTGDLSRWSVKHGMARELTCQEAIELLRKFNEDGLVSSLNINSFICNCCQDCCLNFIGYAKGANIFLPSPFVAQVAGEECIACGTCLQRCPAGAIRVDSFAIIDQSHCLGCGVCVPSCGVDAVRLVRRPPSEHSSRYQGL